MKKSTQTPLFRCIISNVCTIPCGLPFKLLFFLKIGQIVICPVRGTYKHETNLTPVNSTNNICFKFKIVKSTRTRQFRDNTANACTIPGGLPFTLLFFLKIFRWLYVPSEVHITTFGLFYSKMKKPLKLPVEQNLEG